MSDPFPHLSVLAGFLVLLVPLPCAGQVAPVPEPCEDLRALIDSGSYDSLDSPLPRLAIDAGASALTALRPYLELPESDERREMAEIALAYIGGDAAVELLRARLGQSDDATSRTLLAFAFGSTGRQEERELLRRWLEGEHFGEDWPPVVAAALSLGVLRDAEALPDLRKTAENPSSIAGDAAREAVSWIENGSSTVSAPGFDLHPAVAAVLENGIPNGERSQGFYDPDRKACWFRSRAGWELSTRACGDELPTLRLELHVSPDGNRALVSVGLTFGPLDGIGYDYVVRRDGKGWRVQGVMFTWIS